MVNAMITKENQRVASDEQVRRQEAGRDYLALVMRVKGWKATHVAKNSGVNPSTINRFLNNENVTHALDPETLKAVQSASGVPFTKEIQQLYGLKSSTNEADPAPDQGFMDLALGRPNFVQVPPPARPDHENKIRELGLAQAGDRGDFYFNGETVDFHARPPGLAHRMQVYTIRVQGDSMEPIYSDGDLLFIDAARRPLPDRDAVIQFKPTDESGSMRAFIKRVVTINSEFVDLKEWKPKERTFRVPRSKIYSLHLVLKNNDMY